MFLSFVICLFCLHYHKVRFTFIGLWYANKHNIDLRDSREYTKKQVWGEHIFTRQSSRGFDLVETRRIEASSIVYYDSAHTTYLETICVLSYVAQI